MNSDSNVMNSDAPLSRLRCFRASTRLGSSSSSRLPARGLAAEPAALPHREIAILDRQIRQRRGTPLGEGSVESGQLTAENRLRPAVRDDVMLVDEQDILAVCQPNQNQPQERSAGQIESSA